jgi:hypothetical protein
MCLLSVFTATSIYNPIAQHQAARAANQVSLGKVFDDIWH